MLQLCKAIVRPNPFLNLKLNVEKDSVKFSPLTFALLLPFNPPNVCPFNPSPTQHPHLNTPPPHETTTPLPPEPTPSSPEPTLQ